MAPNTTLTANMHTFAARHNTFTIAHQLSKRRASQTNGKKKAAGANVVEWTHEQPTGEDLARAGFFFRPAIDSPDNVQCFLCSVKLDGWEPSDNPIEEHLAHSGSCVWARSIYAGSSAQRDYDAAADPMSEDLVAARKGTFNVGLGWPHEDKKGWKCKIGKMVEAGWCYDPAPAGAEGVGEEEEADGVTCFYCDISLDGWEPKDDPMAEHQKRSPECAFFALVEKFGSGTSKKAAKGRGKKGASRASTASKASSRLSTQSALSTFSQEPSLADIGAGLESNVDGATVDDSIMSTASTATATGKGTKKAGRPKGAPKGGKGRKRAGTVDSQVEHEPLYPDLGAASQSQDVYDEEIRVSSPPLPVEEPAPAPEKKGRKGTRQSKQPQVESSILEISSMEVSAPAKKTTRGRKPKTQPEPEPPVADASDNSDVSAQLQEELERSMDFDAQPEDTAPQPEELSRSKRGVKRTSEGLAKRESQLRTVSAVVVEFPVPPKAATGPKGKKGRQASKQIAPAVPEDQDTQADEQQSTQEDTLMSELEPAASKQTETKKAPAKGKRGGRKASSTRSSRSSKATVVATEPEQTETQEDLERDEREIEAELERIAAEQAALQVEQENTAEFEVSPSQQHTEQVRSAVSSQAGSRRQSTKAKLSSPPQLPLMDFSGKTATPSPAGSDKENQPSSAAAPSTKKQPPAQAPMLSPTKTTRIPLAPGTPNRALLSPSKRLSLTKQVRQLTSTQPWKPIDLDNVLLVSPQPTPGTLANRLAGAAGTLTSPEKGLTVEGWIMRQAEKADEDLRRKCEEMVGVFEREGVRALGSLQGIVVGGT
ncbi:uncharacterized protein LTR77_000847 [Saxophila tyrrhenica]|uniref:BIR-domain-containing protein n=1 Tax=Saxophila tyrrhenica TaxID=1690608 RepID=A0AAV9PTP1_9PEZI|nr:hypothetical protein LTR77_000847 [Saxophila tyrrhenica]